MRHLLPWRLDQIVIFNRVSTHHILKVVGQRLHPPRIIPGPPLVLLLHQRDQRILDLLDLLSSDDLFLEVFDHLVVRFLELFVLFLEFGVRFFEAAVFPLKRQQLFLLVLNIIDKIRVWLLVLVQKRPGELDLVFELERSIFLGF